MACWPREQAGRRRLLRRRWHYGDRGDKKRGVGGAANDGEGGGALGRIGEGSKVEERQRRRRLGNGGHGGEKSEDAKRRRTATTQAIYDGQEARGNHIGVFSAPARHRGRPQSRLEADRSTPAMRCLPRALFTEITEPPLVLKPKLLPNLYNNSKISKNKSCSKLKVLQLCFCNHTQIRPTF